MPDMKLSVIVPVYNELEQLPIFMEMLSAQESVDLELVISDGGSDDGSQELVERLASDYRWPIRLVRSVKGRGRQLNAGASAAKADNLLFLHVDSVFFEVYTLRRALDALDLAINAGGDYRVAGHFALKFSRTDSSSEFGYYFWECKARLNRPECTHGDQGFLLRKPFYEEAGPFDVDAPIAEDTRFAERIRQLGQWFLLPDQIWTSARRFEVEGLQERQTLNALIMNFSAIGWQSFFAEASHVYRAQSESARLDLNPFFNLIDRLNRQAPYLTTLSTWYRTGVYVRPNAWQLAFLQDVKRNFKRQVPAGEIDLKCLELHDLWFDRVTDNIFGRTIAMIGTWLWYRMTVIRYRRRIE